MADEADVLNQLSTLAEVVCIQEWRKGHAGCEETLLANGRKCYSGGAQFRSCAILLSSTLADCVLEVQRFDFGISLRLELHQRIYTIISTHLPHRGRPVHEYCEALASLEAHLPNGDLLIIGGDLNVELGACGTNDTHGDSVIGEYTTFRHQTDEDLSRAAWAAETLRYHHLEAVNTHLPPASGIVDTHHLWGRHMEEGQQIDYVLCRGLVGTSANTIHVQGSDHRVVQVRLLAPHPAQRRHPKRRYTRKVSPKWIPCNSMHFERDLDQSLQNHPHMQPSTLESQWELYVQTVTGAVQRHTPGREDPTMCTDIRELQLRRAQKDATTRRENSGAQNAPPSGSDWIKTQRSRHVISRFLPAKTKTHLLHRLPSARCFQDFWEEVYTAPLGEAHALHQACQAFTAEPDTAFAPLTLEMVQLVIAKSKNSSAGSDGIPAAVYKHMGQYSLRMLTAFFNQVIQTHIWPDSWRTVPVQLTPKSPYADTPSQFRPLAVTSTGERLFDACLLVHLRLHPYPGCLNQLARSHTQPQEGVGLLHALGHAAYATKHPLIYVKLDVQKAFDSVLHSTLLNALHSQGVPEWLRQAIYLGIRNRCLHFRAGHISTDDVNIQRGLLQGKPTSPDLFMRVQDFVLRPILHRLQALGVNVHGIQANHLAYMDDFILIASSIADAQQMIELVQSHLAHAGLHLNASKTSWAASGEIVDAFLRVGGTDVARSTHIMFLGTVITPGRPSKAHVAHRIQQAQKTYFSWSSLLQHRG
eukprot:6492485-Amphidinium_carterae.1